MVGYYCIQSFSCSLVFYYHILFGNQTSSNILFNYLEPDMEQQTGCRLGKEYIKAVCCHPAYLTYMQSTSCETLGWMKHKLGSRFPGEISITSDTQMIPPLWHKVKKNERAF